MPGLKSSILVICAIILCGCSREATGTTVKSDLATCKQDAYKTFSAQVPGRDDSVGEYVESCMNAKGHKLAPLAFGACTRLQLSCYQ